MGLAAGQSLREPDPEDAHNYLRVVKIIYFDDPAQGFEPMRRELGVVLTVASLAVTFFVFYPGPLLESAAVATKTFFP